jgi:peptidyl-prolyl cis-trans isomerase B (cyclophilin B)
MSSWKTTVKFAFALGVLVAALIASYVFEHRPDTSSYVVKGSVFPDLVVDELTKIEMKKDDLSLTLSLKGDDWLIEEQFGFPAKKQAVETLLGTLRRYNDASVFSDKKELHADFSVTDATGVIVKLYSGEALVADFIAGKASFTPTTGFIRKAGDDKVLEVYGNNASLFNPRPSAWLKTNLFDIPADNIQTIKVEGFNKPPVELEMKDGEWKFVPESVETPNARFVSTVANYLSSMTFKEVVDAANELVDKQLDPPSWEISFTTKGGELHVLKLGKKKDNEHTYAMFDDKPYVVSIMNRITDQLTVTRESVVSGNVSSPSQPQQKAPHPTKYAVQGKDEPLPQVKIVTNKGEFVVELWEDDAPNTVANFIYLVVKGFFNGLTFHRHEPGVVLQGGDPNGNGTGGPGWKIEAEVNGRKYDAGVLGMADSGVDTAGSQFFFAYQRMPQWDGRYTTFGVIVSGQDIFNQLTKDDSIVRMEVLSKRNHEYRPFVYKDGATKDEQVQ